MDDPEAFADDRPHAFSPPAWRAWLSLPQHARTLLWHRVVERESAAQLGLLLGLAPRRVPTQVRRARRALRQALAREHGRAGSPAELIRQEVRRVDATLQQVIAPMLLGGVAVAARYLAAVDAEAGRSSRGRRTTFGVGRSAGHWAAGPRWSSRSCSRSGWRP